MKITDYGDQIFTEKKQKEKKPFSLQISSNADITVYAPYFTPVAEIDRFVEEKRKWIDRTLRRPGPADSSASGKRTRPEKNFIIWAGCIL